MSIGSPLKRLLFTRALVPSFAWFAAAFMATSCETPATKPRPQPQPKGDASPIPDEISLREDRSSLEELRKGEPEEIRKQNDELALLLGLMKDGTEEPSKVRERYNKIVRDKREKMDKRLRKERDAFSKSEKKSRDDFMKAAAKDRAKFMARKRSPEASKDFFDQQENKRKARFDEEREKRQEFEAAMQTQRKDFDDYVREKTNWFNQEMRAYSTSYYERKAAEQKQKDMADKERRLSRPAAPLQPDDPPMGN